MSHGYLLRMLLFDRVIRALVTEGAYSFVPVSKSCPRATMSGHIIIELSAEIVDGGWGIRALNIRPGNVSLPT